MLPPNRKKNIIILSLFVFLVLSPLQVFADVTVTHQFVSSETAGSETAVTLDINVSNTSLSTLSEVTLDVIGPVNLSDTSPGTLSVGSIPAESTIVQTWNLQVLGTEQISSVFAGELYLSVAATNESGEAVYFEIASAGGAE